MNLRDKLRSGPEQGMTEAELEVPEAPAAKGKAKARPKLSAPGVGVPKLDVNKRFMLIAAAAAMMTALSAVVYLNNAGSGLQEGGTKVAVLVPKDDIPAGTRLTEDNTTTFEIPKAYLPKGYLTDASKLKDHVAIAPMVANEPIIEARISAPDAKYGIAYLLKPGERAKTINVDSASGLAGLIKPGNEVDVIATIPDPNNDNRMIGTPVIQKARAIAVGSHLMGEVPRASSGDDDGNKAENNGSGISSENTITLAIPGEKVAVVTLMEQKGSLKMVLRAVGDNQIAKTPFSDDVIMSLLSGKVPNKPKPPAKPKAPPKKTPPKKVSKPVVHTHVTLFHAPPVHHEPPPRPKPVVHHAAPPKPKPPVVHHEAPPKPKPPVVHHNPPPANTGHGPEVIRFGGGGN